MTVETPRRHGDSRSPRPAVVPTTTEVRRPTPVKDGPPSIGEITLAREYLNYAGPAVAALPSLNAGWFSDGSGQWYVDMTRNPATGDLMGATLERRDALDPTRILESGSIDHMGRARYQNHQTGTTLYRASAIETVGTRLVSLTRPPESGVNASALEMLSPREQEVLEQVARGLTNKQLGRELGLSEQTVKNHMTSILRKLEVPNRTLAAMRVYAPEFYAHLQGVYSQEGPLKST